MIDLIRIHYSDKTILEQFVEDNETLFPNYISIGNYRKDFFTYPRYADILGLQAITIGKECAFFKISLHYLANILKGEGEHNYNDFTYSELCTVIDCLCDDIIDLDTTNITQLEFGININTSKSSKDIINNNVLMYKLKSPTRNIENIYKEFKYQNYIVKIYDKATHFKKLTKGNQNILRFEIKYIKKTEFNKLGIKYITDLKDKSKLKKLFDDLLNKLDDVLIIDDKYIKNENLEEIDKYVHQHFWDNFNREQRNKKSKYLKRLNEILKKENLLKIKNEIKTSLINKHNYLINN